MFPKKCLQFASTSRLVSTTIIMQLTRYQYIFYLLNRDTATITHLYKIVRHFLVVPIEHMVLKLKVLIQTLQENSEKVNFSNGFQRGSFIWRPFFSSVLWLYLRILRLISRSSDFRIFFSCKYKFSKI